MDTSCLGKDLDFAKDTDLGCGLRRLMQIDLQCNFVSVRDGHSWVGFWDSGAGGLWFCRCVHWIIILVCWNLRILNALGNGMHVVVCGFRGGFGSNSTFLRLCLG